jgi:hypothetical protein
MSMDEVIDVTGREVPKTPIRLGAHIGFTPTADIRGLVTGVTHLGMVIGQVRGRPVLRIFSPLGRDATFEFTGSEGEWAYFNVETQKPEEG